MKLLVTGSRHYKNSRRVRGVLTAYLILADKLNQDFTVIVGDCPTGADKYTRTWCEQHRVTVRTYSAEWNEHGKAAGPIRNVLMVDEEHPDDCVAFYEPDAMNKGTEHCATYAESKGVRTYRIRN